jgi:hypothetical protein
MTGDRRCMGRVAVVVRVGLRTLGTVRGLGWLSLLLGGTDVSEVRGGLLGRGWGERADQDLGCGFTD